MIKTALRPKFDRVVLKADTPEEVSKGGIILPAVAQEKTKTSTVIAVGPEVKDTRAGDHVMHTKYVGVEVEIDGEQFIVVKEAEIQATLVEVEVPDLEPVELVGDGCQFD